MKKKVVFVLGLVVVVIVLVLIIFIGDRPLDLESEEVTQLYSYLGEVNAYHCGGLNQYTGEEVTYDDIANNHKMCIAYYELDSSSLEHQSASIVEVNDSDIPICEVGEGILITAEEDEDLCYYQVVSKSDLASAYEKIYGQELPEEESFDINVMDVCYLQGDNYYCGGAETFDFSLASEATIYRLLDKAVETIQGDIVISDYYLRISNNACYSSNGNADMEISDCTSALAENPDTEITTSFIQQYGVIYQHTFKKDQNDNYYWFASEPK